MMDLLPLTILLYILVLATIVEVLLIIHACRKDKNSRGQMHTTTESEDTRGDLAVPSMQNH